MLVTVCLGSHQSQSVQPISIPGRAMNKQPSKESLKDKVKGIFGLGPPRPPSKQSDTKPSEFIITTDIIKVCRETLHVHTHARIHRQIHLTYHSSLHLPGAPPRLWSEQSRSHDEPRLWSCQNEEIWGGEHAPCVRLWNSSTCSHLSL